MSWLSRWGIKNMRKWGGWHSLEDREEFLLSQIEYLQSEISNLKTKNKIIEERLGKTKELALSAVIEYFNKNILIQHTEHGIYYTELKNKKKSNKKAEEN